MRFVAQRHLIRQLRKRGTMLLVICSASRSTAPVAK
jgi:hypothetical protein